MTLRALVEWVKGVPASLPEMMRPMAESICASFQTVARRLMELGLGYLTLDRAAATLSTGERQRMQLARAVRKPHNRRALCAGRAVHRPASRQHRRPDRRGARSGGGRQFRAAGGSRRGNPFQSGLGSSKWGLARARRAGRVVAQGTVADLVADARSVIGPFLSGARSRRLRPCVDAEAMFAHGRLRLKRRISTPSARSG